MAHISSGFSHSAQFEKSQSFVQLVAKFNYAASESTELSIKKGEKLTLMDSTGDWWTVKNSSNKIGKVPSNHVEIRSDAVTNSSSKKAHKSQSFFKKILGGKDKKNQDRQLTESLNGMGSVISPLGASFNDSGTYNGYTISQNPVSFGASPHAANRSPTSSGSTLNNNNSNALLNSFPIASSPETAIAIYNYQAMQADELNLTKGDQVTVLQKSTDGWWQVLCNGRTGWIPSNYLNVNTTTLSSPTAALSKPQPAESVFATNKSTESSRETPVLAKDPKIDGVFMFGVVALYKFQAQDLNELTFEKDECLDIIGEPTSDQDWWQARNSQGSMGLIPKKFVRQMPDAKPVFRRPNSGGPVASSAVMRSNVSPGSNVTTSLKSSSAIVNSIKQETFKYGPYKDRDWYYGRISRNDCEKLFDDFGDYGDFIVRESESCPGDYSVSLKAQPKNRHFHVQLQAADNKLLIGSKTFDNLDQIIEHYRIAPIYTDGSGTRLFLQKPLIV